MKDIFSDIGLAIAIPSATYAADNTPAAIDLRGFNSAVIALSIGVGGITFSASNKIEFVLTHSNDGVTYEAVTTDDVQGVTIASGGIIKALTAAHAAASLTKIGYVGAKRYLKLLADFSGTHGTGTPISSLVIKGHPSLAPVA
ncbi:hypothetical protein SAMN05880590_1107 [Rhizobium sp. RU35A]|uniref:hypothetical protein n=1 Tax=Rhizobium sp. RU35A TaxID=1907414 RepID=UPI00095644C8|nr:hypothetical protein [Rhizobium sp. RU35A]SIQ98836.1 hypothetical protein SAMN05880590_1107 [Rhizobium sp. RU35A]